MTLLERQERQLARAVALLGPSAGARWYARARQQAERQPAPAEDVVDYYLAIAGAGFDPLTKEGRLAYWSATRGMLDGAADGA